MAWKSKQKRQILNQILNQETQKACFGGFEGEVKEIMFFFFQNFNRRNETENEIKKERQGGIIRRGRKRKKEEEKECVRQFSIYSYQRKGSVSKFSDFSCCACIDQRFCFLPSLYGRRTSDFQSARWRESEMWDGMHRHKHT